ncbi:MAG: hypothetical protein ACI9U5_001352 [Colwellia sp.]|jgi:hypothetical protein
MSFVFILLANKAVVETILSLAMSGLSQNVMNTITA